MFRYSLALLLTLASLAACGGSVDNDDDERGPIGAPLRATDLCHLRIGTTTVADVIRALGQPPLTGPSGGQTLLQYVYIDGGGVVRESTLFWFDGPGGTLQRVERVIADQGQLPECLRAQQPG